MSHFTVFVLTDNGTGADVEKLLAPYDENLEMPKYNDSCFCVGDEARRAVAETVIDQLGSMEDVRAKYEALINAALAEKGIIKPPKDVTDEVFQVYMDAYWTYVDGDGGKKVWHDLIAPRVALETELFNNHPLKDSPDPDCEDCNGTGVVQSSYNPDSKWDWWEIGGRWNDTLGGSNVKSAMDVRYGLDGGYMDVPYALVNPAGEWLEQGQMGWWGISSGDMPEDDWKAIVRDQLNKYPATKVVLVDCHI